MNRRSLLVGAGTSFTALLAGCASSSDVDGGSRENEDSDGAESSNNSGDSESSPEESAEIEILDHELVVEEGDFSTDVYVEATVENTGEIPSGDIRLQSDWYDTDGNYLDNDTGRLASLGAGETWAARVYYLGTDAEDIENYEIQGEYDESSYEEPEGVSLVESSMTVEEGDFGGSEVIIEGRVENESDEDQDYVEVVATIYNGSGDVIGDEWANVTDLRAGETWAFDFSGFSAPVRNRADQAEDHNIRIKTSPW